MLDSCCCLSKGIGFAREVWPGVAACFVGTDYVMIPNVAQDLTLLDRCRIVFLGHHNSCGNVIFDIPIAALSTYLNQGGRIWLSGEYGKDPAPGTTLPSVTRCLTNQLEFNQYVSDLGSEIIIEDNFDDSGINCDVVSSLCTPEANISDGLAIRIALSAVVGSRFSGNRHPIIGSSRGNVVVAVTPYETGAWLFVSGDSNITDGCAFDNCAFIRRLADYENNQIL